MTRRDALHNLHETKYYELLELLHINRLNEIFSILQPDKLTFDEKNQVVELNDKINCIILNLTEKEKLCLIRKMLDDSFCNDPTYYRNVYLDIQHILHEDGYKDFIIKKRSEGLI